MCTKFNSAMVLAYVPPLQPRNSINRQDLNLKSEVDRRKTFKLCRVPFMDVNQLAAAGFFFTNRGEVRCAFCSVQVAQLKNDAFKDHQRRSPSCPFVRRLFVGNIPAPPKTFQQKRSSSNDVCGSCMEYTPNTSRPQRCKYIFTYIYFLLCAIIAVR